MKKQTILVLIMHLVLISGSYGSSITPNSINKDELSQKIESTVGSYHVTINQQIFDLNQRYSNLLNNLVPSVNLIRHQINLQVNSMNNNITMIQNSGYQDSNNLRQKLNLIVNNLKSILNEKINQCKANNQLDYNQLNLYQNMFYGKIDSMVNKMNQLIDDEQNQWSKTIDTIRDNLNHNLDEINKIINSHSDQLIETLNSWRSDDLIKINQLTEKLNDKANHLRNQLWSQLPVDQLIKLLTDLIDWESLTLATIQKQMETKSTEINSFWLKQLTNDDDRTKLWSLFQMEDLNFFSTQFKQSINNLTKSIENDDNNLSLEIKTICTN